MSTAVKNARTIVASAANAAGATTRGRLDLQTAIGGMLTIRMTNGGTGPTTQCVARILVAHNATMPDAGAEGADWKQVSEIGGGVANNGITRDTYRFGMEVMCIEVEFSGNTGQGVTVEAYVSEVTSVS